MANIKNQFDRAFRDYSADGVAASGAHEPIKSEVRDIGRLIEQAIGNITLVGLATVKKDTRANLNADLAHEAGTIALVYGDPVASNIDLYFKTGASGLGGWTLTTILHDAFAGTGESATAVARRTGAWGAAASDTDLQVLIKLASYLIAENPGFQGEKGEHGGNVMSIGLRDDLAGIEVAAGTDLVQTTGDSAVGEGPWQWIRSPDQASGGSDYRKQDSAGAWFDKLDRIIVNFGPAAGGTAAGVTYLLDPRKARHGMIATDAAPGNDEMNFFAGVVGQLGRQPLASDIELFSHVVARNSYVIGGGYGAAYGHDCLNLAVAAIVGGAGTVVGRHDNPAQGLVDKNGYCSIGWGKNGETKGQSAAGFGELFRANARSSFAATYQSYVEDTAALGAVGLGPYTTVANGGLLALGTLITASGPDRMAIGSGVNPGSRLVNDIDGSLQIGASTLRGTVVFEKGTPADAYAGKVSSRSGWRSMSDIGAIMNADMGSFRHLVNNSAANGTSVARIETRNAGTVVPVIDVRHDFMQPVTDNAVALGGASNRFSTVYAASGTINTSDERAKQDFDIIPDEWLNAWGEVEWMRFRFKAAVAEKGEGARWHIGLVAQRVRDVFANRGLDAHAIGLLCYDQWKEVTEPVLEYREQKTIALEWIEGDGDTQPHMAEIEHSIELHFETGETQVVREAGSLWGLRYEECFAMEAAWQRREISRLKARLP